MAKGRPPKPTAVKKLTGTQRKGRLKNEPQAPLLTAVPIAPGHWEQPEVDRYYRICEMLRVNGLLEAVSIELIFAYVEEMKMYFHSIDMILKQGAVIEYDSGPKVNPWVRARDMAIKNAMAIAREFGFTPSSRTKINATPINQKEPDEWDGI